MLLLLVHQVRHQAPEPAPAPGLRQARNQREGGADRGGAGGPILYAGNVNGTRGVSLDLTEPLVLTRVQLKSAGFKGSACLEAGTKGLTSRVTLTVPRVFLCDPAPCKR